MGFPGSGFFFLNLFILLIYFQNPFRLSSPRFVAALGNIALHGVPAPPCGPVFPVPLKMFMGFIASFVSVYIVVVVINSLYFVVVFPVVMLYSIYEVCLFLFLLLLILSGDVEFNPGPAAHFHKKKCSVLYSNIRGMRSNFLDLQSHARNYPFSCRNSCVR